MSRSRADIRSQQQLCVCVFFPFILDVKFVGSTSRGQTGFLIHLSSAVRTFIFLARRIQPFLSLVDREVELRKNLSYRDSNSRPNVSEGYEVMSYREKKRNKKKRKITIEKKKRKNTWRLLTQRFCSCLCVFFPFILGIKFVGRLAGVTLEGGHTGFFIHLPSAVRALIFLARRIQPFLSLVYREIESCVLTI